MGDDELDFPELPQDTAAFEEVARRYGLRAGGYAVVHPGASAPTRRWPPAKFAAVADGLSARGLDVVLSGVAGEEPITAAVRRLAGRPVVDLTGATGLGTLAALLRRAALVVSNDTGTAHLAAATRTPSVTVFMAGDPVRWAHRDPRHRVARAADVPCSPCPHLTCPIDLGCGHLLSADAVLREVDALPR